MSYKIDDEQKEKLTDIDLVTLLVEENENLIPVHVEINDDVFTESFYAKNEEYIASVEPKLEEMLKEKFAEDNAHAISILLHGKVLSYLQVQRMGNKRVKRTVKNELQYLAKMLYEITNEKAILVFAEKDGKTAIYNMASAKRLERYLAFRESNNA
jgi:predicted house-cleaning noncanonical NTP pyrophosphatase (MazG superfamily)